MSALGFGLVISAALCHAIWNFFVKKINGGPELIWLFSVVSVVLYFPLAVYFWIEVQFDPWSLAGVFILGSALLHLGYFLLLQTGYRHGDLSLVYPTARATGPILSVSFAVLFLGETLAASIALGGVLIILGILALTRRPSLAGTNTRFVSVAFGVSVGAFIGCYTAWDAYAVATVGVAPVLLDYATGVVRSVVLAPIAWRNRAQVQGLWSNHRREVFLIALFCPAAYILVLVALTFTPVIYVAPLREVSVLFAIILGSWLLKEGQLKSRLGWGVVILAGVAVLTSGS